MALRAAVTFLLLGFPRLSPAGPPAAHASQDFKTLGNTALTAGRYAEAITKFGQVRCQSVAARGWVTFPFRLRAIDRLGAEHGVEALPPPRLSCKQLTVSCFSSGITFAGDLYRR